MIYINTQISYIHLLLEYLYKFTIIQKIIQKMQCNAMQCNAMQCNAKIDAKIDV